MELTTDVSIPYVDSEDAFEIFATVVNNNQTRLALEVLVDLLATVINKVNELDDIVGQIVTALTEEDEPQEEVLETKPEQKAVIEESEKEPEVEKPAQKTKTKKEESEIKE